MESSESPEELPGDLCPWLSDEDLQLIGDLGLPDLYHWGNLQVWTERLLQKYHARISDSRAVRHRFIRTRCISCTYVKWRLDEDNGLDDAVFTDDLEQKYAPSLRNMPMARNRLLMDLVCGATTVKKLRGALETLPLNYAEAYQNTLDRIFQQDQDRQELATHALHWVCNSRRPSDMTELQHAIAILDEDAVSGKEDLQTERTIISSCLAS
ncbi:hypothetical protein EDB80DRAFT_862791 [Ilyonectria destructans]|nr:hypothetical protein EDB80DRAFT_862791 [Ilyonectria destructans]